jgi:ParB family transcriptional regulator, chromosome partitioning protein
MAAREVLRLPLASLVDDPNQPRRHVDADALASLAQSIAAVGQLEPILVRSGDANRTYITVEGHRRAEAMRSLGRTEIDALVVDASLRPTDILLNQLVLGVQRENLGPIDLARGLDSALKSSGKSRGNVAKILGLSEPTICRKLQLLTALSPGLQEMVAAGKLSEGVALEIAKAGDFTVQERLAAEVLARGATRDALAGQLRRRKGGTPSTEKPPARFVACLEGGRSITFTGPGLDSIDSVIEWAEGFLSHARKARPKGIEISTFARLLRDQAKVGAKTAKGEG